MLPVMLVIGFAGDPSPVYERCITPRCLSTPGVTVHAHRDSTSPFDMRTIFEITNATGKGGRRARYLLNRASTVRLGATGFVSGPRKANKLAASVCKRGGWTGTLAEAQAKCQAYKHCDFVHDADCDGRRWRYCKGSADQQVTGNALACIKIKVKSSGMSYSFRNPPNFMPLAGEIYYGSEGFTSDFRKPQVRRLFKFACTHRRTQTCPCIHQTHFPGDVQAMHETDALIDHLFFHPNTPPFIAHRLIQRMTTSNPSPKYVKAVATAFTTGTQSHAESGHQHVTRLNWHELVCLH